MTFLNPFDRQGEIGPHNVWYANILSDFWQAQNKWDGFDLTSDILLGDEKRDVKAKIFAKSPGILAGQAEAEFFLREEEDGLSVSSLKLDGDELLAGEKVMEIWGDAKTILHLERTLVNFLSRLSGIATLTKNVVKMLPPGVHLCATRKTLWGPIDKKGVIIGGGSTHRLGLFDAVLVKENHLTLFHDDIPAVVGKIDAAENVGAFWDIEVENEADFRALLKNPPKKRPGIIMLDNFSPSEAAELIASVEKPEGIFFELSGGINPKNILAFAEAGADALSVGFITNAVSPVDFSMQVTL